ncbi:hypothetical protein PG997_010702 [Apiospora hydei]|uniref:Uncharacterized protein n=1 Tax=Apiospora hydei TaxID=1337664 RepID=A0ABR1VGY0_9PEZI
MVYKHANLSLDLSLYGSHPDQEDIFCKTLLEDLPSNPMPYDAAGQFTTWVIRESMRRLEQIRIQPAFFPMAGTTVQRTTAPDASGLTKRFFQGFARLCACFPPGGTEQDKLMKFIQYLTWLKDEAPDSFPDPFDLSKVTMLKLWGPGVIDPEPFRVYNAELLSTGARTGMNRCFSEAGLRWRNYQSALALITKSGLIDCSFLSGLRDILPQRDTAVKCPTPKWITGHEMFTWVYDRCMEKEKTDEGNPQDIWSKENWETWKVQLDFYSSNDRVEKEARSSAGYALSLMKWADEHPGNWDEGGPYYLLPHNQGDNY